MSFQEYVKIYEFYDTSLQLMSHPRSHKKYSQFKNLRNEEILMKIPTLVN